MKNNLYFLICTFLIAGCGKLPDQPIQDQKPKSLVLQCEKNSDCSDNHICYEKKCEAPASGVRVVVTDVQEIEAAKLDSILGGLVDGCEISQKFTNIKNAYLVRVPTPSGYGTMPKLKAKIGKNILPNFGKVDLVLSKLDTNSDQFFTMTIPVSDATLFGIPVSKITYGEGLGYGLFSYGVEFSLPMAEVKKRLSEGGVRLKSRVVEDGMDDVAPTLELVDGNPSHTELSCVESY